MASYASSRAVDAPALPSEGVRGVVTLLLIIHLFAVATVLISNATKSLSPDGTDREAQSLGQRLRMPFLNPYTQFLFPNEPSNLRNYRLTHDEYIDVDYQVFFDMKLKDGSVETFELPPPGIGPGQRRQRYQALANRAGQWLVLEAAGRGDENILPRMLAQRVVELEGATSGRVRIRGHRTIEPQFAIGTDKKAADPFDPSTFATTYSASILVGRDGNVRLLKAAAAGETAPVGRGGHAAPTLPPVPSNPQSPTPPTSAGAAGPTSPASPAATTPAPTSPAPQPGATP